MARSRSASGVSASTDSISAAVWSERSTRGSGRSKRGSRVACQGSLRSSALGSEMAEEAAHRHQRARAAAGAEPGSLERERRSSLTCSCVSCSARATPARSRCSTQAREIAPVGLDRGGGEAPQRGGRRQERVDGCGELARP